jgi:hypothetical protein
VHQRVRIRPIQNTGCQNQPKKSATNARMAMKGYPSRRIGTSIFLIDAMMDSAEVMGRISGGPGAA